jgi:hypothetical protein
MKIEINTKSKLAMGREAVTIFIASLPRLESGSDASQKHSRDGFFVF